MNIFELFAKLFLDTGDYEKGLDDAEKKSGSFANKLKSGLATAAKVTAAAMTAVGTAATAATVKLAKEAVSAYADYEQLVGGVETLFADSAGLVQSYAANAYKTAGLSANDYMETVTSFSSSLLQSLGGDTERAANVADMAIRDMSDNANKMGTSMESIQTAYQGFAKQNYTMLDNLKLGYGGTKSEMERLILDAESLNDTFTASRDENGDLAMSYADIVDAIHIVQDEMGITGTTAKEASATIAGSVSAAKSAWQNLVAGLANDNADMTLLIDNFVESVGTAGKNILPRVEKALQGVGRLVSSLGPTIAKSAPGIIKSVAPSMISAISDVVMAISEQLPEISTPILVSLIAMISQNAPTIVTALVNGITTSLPTLVSVAADTIVTLADAFAANLPLIINAAATLIITMASTLTEPDMLGKLVDSAIAIILALANGLVDALPDLIERAPEIVGNLVDAIIENAPKLFKAALELIVKLGQGIVNNFPKLIEKGKEIITKIGDGLLKAILGVTKWAKEIIDKFTAGFSWDKVKEIGKNIIEGIWKGISGAADWLWGKVKGWANGLLDGVKGIFGIHSPSKEFAKIGKFMIEGLGKGFDDNYADVANDINDKMEELTENAQALATDLSVGTPDAMFGGGEVVTETEMPSLSNALDGIYDILKQILANMDFDIVLNDGVIAGRVDKLLGQSAMRKARGGAW